MENSNTASRRPTWPKSLLIIGGLLLLVGGGAFCYAYAGRDRAMKSASSSEYSDPTAAANRDLRARGANYQYVVDRTKFSMQRTQAQEEFAPFFNMAITATCIGLGLVSAGIISTLWFQEPKRKPGTAFSPPRAPE